MRKLAMLIVVALLAAGCGSGDGKDAGTAPPAVSSPGGLAARQRGLPPELKFEGTTLDGKPFTGVNLAERPVVFWFWAPWCPSCQSEGPAVAKVAKKYEGKVAFVGVAGLDKSKDKMRQFVERTGTGGITHLDDGTGRLYKHFGVTSQSSYLFVAMDGKTSRGTGPLSESDLEGRVGGLVGG